MSVTLNQGLNRYQELITYKTGSLKTLVSPKKIAMYQGKIKGVYKTIAKKSAIYAIGSTATNASDEGSKYIFGELLGWL